MIMTIYGKQNETRNLYDHTKKKKIVNFIVIPIFICIADISSHSFFCFGVEIYKKLCLYIYIYQTFLSNMDG